MITNNAISKVVAEAHTYLQQFEIPIYANNIKNNFNSFIEADSFNGRILLSFMHKAQIVPSATNGDIVSYIPPV